jgi:hypothetical protein
MRTYFWAANFWALVTLVILLGRHTERSGPTMYSFFGLGGWYSPGEYSFRVAIPAVIAFVCLVAFKRSRAS